MYIVHGGDNYALCIFISDRHTSFTQINKLYIYIYILC